MGPHDIEREEHGVVWCACGRPFEGPKARDAHSVHFYIERARAALRGIKETAE